MLTLRRSIALAALGAAAPLANAQLGALTDGLSSTCTSAAYSLVSSEFASCSSLLSLVSVATSSGSVVSSIDSYLNTVCTSGTNCSDAAIANATSIIDNGCATEISNEQVTVTLIRSVVANFNGIKEGACLASTSNNTFCVTNLLTDLQNATGTDITLSTLTNLDASTLSSIPSSAVCTDCSHALVTELSPLFSNDTSSITSAVSGVCGESFTDGQIPSTVSQKTSSNSSSNGAVESSDLNGAAGIVGAGAWKAAGGALLGVAGLALLA